MTASDSETAIEGLSNARELTIEWGHCDPAGIVFNPRFFEFFDWSTALLVQAATNLDKAAMIRTYGLVGIPLVDTRATFRAPARFGDRVTIVSTIVGLRRSSFAVRHRLSLGADLCCEGHETRVWAGRHPDDPTRLKGQPIPDEVTARMRGGR